MATADLLTMDSKKNADKQKALDSALAQIERQFGKGSIMKLGAEGGHWRPADGAHYRNLWP